MAPGSVIIVKPGSLGDIVLTLPALHFLKSTFHLADFFWVANKEWVPLLQDNPDLKGIVPFPRNRFRGPASPYQFLRWCKQLSTLRPDLVLDFQGLLRSAWISRSLKAKRVLGLSDSREASRYFYDQQADVHQDQHAVERYLELAKLAGADVTGPAQFPLPQGRRIPALELPDRFVVLHPFSRGNDKSLTPNEITQLIEGLAPHPVMVVGRASEDFLIRRNAISLVNQTDLGQLIWLLRRASFIISVDSGPMHIAAAITPSLLSIHTWSDPKSVGPYNPDAWIWKAQHICQVRSLPTKVVWKNSTLRPHPFQIAEFVHERLLL